MFSPTKSYPWNFPMYLGSGPGGGSSSFQTVTPTAAAVGSRVGPVELANPFENLSKVAPWLGGANDLIGQNLQAGFRGELSPSTIRAIQDYAAARGISGGMPGANIFENLGARDIGATSEGLQQRAMQNYASLLPVIASTQTNAPGLQYQVDYQNEVNRAAPDPTAAASYAQEVFGNYMKALQSPAAGSGGFGYSIQPPQMAGGGGSPAMGTGRYMYGDSSGLYGNRNTASPYKVFSSSSPSQSPWANYDFTSAMGSPSYSPILGEDINMPYQGPNYSYGSWLA